MTSRLGAAKAAQAPPIVAAANPRRGAVLGAAFSGQKGYDGSALGMASAAAVWAVEAGLAVGLAVAKGAF